MKLKDLNDDINLKDVKVLLPEHLYNLSSLPVYEIETREVFLVGHVMGDFFVKIDPDDEQMYPMFDELLSWNTLKELEVLEIKKTSYEKR
tara:strand:+ start:216782 stop:217051 length:270 start_codon:yes stop_codon:yes gene_type:complete